MVQNATVATSQIIRSLMCKSSIDDKRQDKPDWGKETGSTEPVDIEVTKEKIREKSMNSADTRYPVISSKS